MDAESFVPDCPGPVPFPRKPRHPAPPGACDCHFHVFGPYRQFPPSRSRGYTPPEAAISSYRRVMRTLGLQRCVVVQPSVYGADNTCTLRVASELGGPDVCRTVAVIDESVDDVMLDALGRSGVRGVRFNAVAGGGPLLEQISAIAGRIARFGWHVQIYVAPTALVEIAPRLAELPTDIVIDHFGGASTEADHAFEALRRLLDSGRVWVKLSGGYMASGTAYPWADMSSVVQALAGQRPDRLVWGTNWPHPVRFREMPDDGDLFDALAGWLPERSVLDRILSRNPEILYGFPALTA